LNCSGRVKSYDWRIKFCTCFYLIFNYATVLISSFTGCRSLINKMSRLLQTSAVLTASISKPKSFWREIEKYLHGGVVVGTFLLILLLHFFFVAFRIPISAQTAYFPTYSLYFFLLGTEQLRLLICSELKWHFTDLNDAILALESDTHFFIKSKSILVCRISKLSAAYSNLSAAFKDVEKLFGLFWMLHISQLCCAIIIVLGYLLIFQLTSTKIIFFSLGFAICALVRLFAICVMCGATTAEV